MMRTLILIATCLLLAQHLKAQHKIDTLAGTWVLQDFYSIHNAVSDKKYDPFACGQFFRMNIGKNKKLQLVFAIREDSAVFGGRIKFMKNGIVRVQNNIHEIIYLDKLEACIPTIARIDIKQVLHRIYGYSLTDDQLTFHYNLPSDSVTVRKMIFVRRK